MSCRLFLVLALTSAATTSCNVTISVGGSQDMASRAPAWFIAARAEDKAELQAILSSARAEDKAERAQERAEDKAGLQAILRGMQKTLDQVAGAVGVGGAGGAVRALHCAHAAGPHHKKWQRHL